MLNFSSRAILRTACRATTMSWSEVRASESLFGTGFLFAFFKEVHSSFDVERGSHVGEAEPQFSQGDCDRRLHPDHHGASIEKARNGRDVSDHSSDERIDYLECGDIDQDPFRAVFFNRCTQIILQLKSDSIVHVDLDRHQQALP